MGNFRRLTAGALALVGAFVLAGCGSGADPETTDTSTSPTSSTSTTPFVEVDKGLLTVDITLTRSQLGVDPDMTDQEIIEDAKKDGMKATVDGDKVTYTMTRAQQRDWLDQARAAVQESFEEIVGEPFTSFAVNDDLSLYTVEVDAAMYTEADALYLPAFYFQGSVYQQFAGVDPADIEVTVELVDDQSGEVLETGSYREWMEEQEG